MWQTQRVRAPRGCCGGRASLFTQVAALRMHRIEAEAELARKLIRAEKGKDQATEALKQARDSGSGAETVAAAEAEWRTALDRWQKLTDGEDPDATEEPTEEPEDEPTEEPEDEPTEEPEETPED